MPRFGENVRVGRTDRGRSRFARERLNNFESRLIRHARHRRSQNFDLFDFHELIRLYHIGRRKRAGPKRLRNLTALSSQVFGRGEENKFQFTPLRSG